jgi:pyridoxal phosphate enzyme (YggS family)
MQWVAEAELTPQLIEDRYRRLLARLRGVADAARRDPAGFRVVAVTKGLGLAVLRTGWEAGLRTFGENRVQEAIPKVEALPDADWHLVGRLQSNKARPAIARFGTIHSVDSIDLLQRLDRIAHDDGRHPRILLQVNITGEPTKAGFALDWFRHEASVRGELADVVGGLRDAIPVGLMTIGPLGVPQEESRAAFGTLRRLRDALQDGSGVALPELSMGMTADADAAVAEGATLVRVGTALFGPRPD